VPDRGRRGEARRRAVLPRCRVGIHGRHLTPETEHRAARVRERAPGYPELQVNLTLQVWRQKNATAAGEFVTYEAKDISPDMSFLEMLDVVNERLIEKGQDP